VPTRMSKSNPSSLLGEVLRESPEDWDTRYRKGKTPWRSRGLSAVVRRYLRYCPRGSDLLEIGCGTGDDALELLALGFAYDGIELSPAATLQAARRLKSKTANLIIGDFFAWTPRKRYAAVYDKGVFHGLTGRQRRLSFSRRVAAALVPEGLWITVCGSADRYDPRVAHGAVRLTHLVEAVEPFFEILHLEKARYGLKKSACDFDAWYGAFQLREDYDRPAPAALRRYNRTT
jgi:SAM-dependent methyltransferase